MLSALVCSLILSTFVNGHSWVRCTKYNAEITGGDYDENECDGWIRGWDFAGVTFALDRGINYQVALGNSASLCQRTIPSDLSTSSDKVPTYGVGSTIRVVWPAKNHANYNCFNFIPDTSMKLYVNNNADPSSDLSNDDSTMAAQGYTLVKDWQDGCTAGTDGCGFQNCPKFCEGTDAATCYGDFTVPDIFSTSGYYTFVWYWIFNQNTDPYISCYEAYVDVDAATTSSPEDESSGSDNDSSSINGYLVQMPICIDGQTYDEDELLTFVQTEFNDLDDVEIEDAEITFLYESEATNGYNVTVQLSVSSGEVSETTTTATTDFCDDFEDEYSGTTCENCADTVTFAQYKSSASVISYLFVGILSTFMAIWIV